MILVWNIICIFWFFAVGKVFSRLELPLIIAMPLFVVVAGIPAAILWRVMIG